MQLAIVVSREEVGIAGGLRLDVLPQPDRASPDRRPEIVQSLRGDKPKIRVRLQRRRVFCLERPGVDELRLGRVVAAEHDAVVPPAEIADHLEIIRAGRDPGGVFPGKGRRKPPEGAVHGGQQVLLADLADARPLGIPPVGAVVAMTALGQAVVMPFPVIQQRQDQGFRVPSHRPERVRRRVFVPQDPAGTGHFGELVAPHQLPVPFPEPLRESAGGDRGIDSDLGPLLAIVGIDQPPLRGIEAFAVITGQLGLQAGFRRPSVAVTDQALRLQGVHIHLVEPFLHGRVVDLALRIGQMTGVTREPAEHPGWRNRADILVPVDQVGTDQQMVRFAVDHTVGRRAADAAFEDVLLQAGGDPIQLVRRSLRRVRRIGNRPQVPLPGDDRPGAAFASVIPHPQMRVDAGDREGFLVRRLRQESARQQDREEKNRACFDLRSLG